MFDSQKFEVLGGTGNHELDEHTIREVNRLGHANLKFLHLNMGEFPDGEPDFRIHEYEKIAGKHVLLFQSIYNVALADQFLTLAWAAKYQYGAKSILGIVPFMRYRRQDRTEKKYEINRNLMFVNNMKWNGIERVIFCDIHSPATLENCKKAGIKAWNVDPAPVFAEHLSICVKLARKQNRPFYIYAPDEGSVPRAVSLAKELDVKIAVDLKNRAHNGEVKKISNPERLEGLKKKYKTDMILAGETLRGASVCIREDELSTGGTASMSGVNLRTIGVKEIFFCATHAVCTPGWKRKIIDNSPFDDMFIGTTIPRGYDKATGGVIRKVHMSRVIAHQLIEIMSDIK